MIPVSDECIQEPMHVSTEPKNNNGEMQIQRGGTSFVERDV